MKSMIRASYKVDGALPYEMVITKIISHFGIVVSNEVASKVDVSDIYNASSLKRMDWKREFEAGKGNVWLPKEGGRKKRRVEEENVEEQSEPQRARTTPVPQTASSSSNSLTLESILDEIKKLNTKLNKMDIKMDNLRRDCLDLFDDQRIRHRRLEKKLIAKGVIEASDISESGEEEEETGEEVGSQEQ
ncbi:hypothetical protein CFOL_v3_20863 [Cephalotus follicularis]|uniref:Uncharacterized protein n=1 Tax=Cephalotus follicularis TaxID=3775 RepID=A0A1Q3CBC1_CEPFO|nr:hypothetical protein CFOL_v3_20863 [Cephalotus follicularis]